MDDLVRYSYSLLGSREDAEDISVEVCLAASRRTLPTQPGEAKRYLLGMARRKVLDRLRRRSRHGYRLPIRQVETLCGPDGLPSERLSLIRDVLARLTPEYAEVLALKYMNGCTADEIAEITGRTTVAINSQLQRARQAFADASNGAFEE